MMFMGRTPQTTSKVIIMKAIVYRLTQGSAKQFEIGEDADKNVIGYFAEMYAGWAS